jgi:hypothetical protein
LLGHRHPPVGQFPQALNDFRPVAPLQRTLEPIDEPKRGDALGLAAMAWG